MVIRTEAVLRQVGGSLDLRLPPEVKRALGLAHGDAVLMEGDVNGLVLRFFKMTKVPIGNHEAAVQQEDGSTTPNEETPRAVHGSRGLITD
jgi:antitoxin component of MazEF toxin-antitoxin module